MLGLEKNVKEGYDIMEVNVDFNIKYQVIGEGFSIFSPLYDSRKAALEAIDDYLANKNSI